MVTKSPTICTGNTDYRAKQAVKTVTQTKVTLQYNYYKLPFNPVKVRTAYFLRCFFSSIYAEASLIKLVIVCIA